MRKMADLQHDAGHLLPETAQDVRVDADRIRANFSSPPSPQRTPSVRKLPLFLWFSFVLLSPVYVFPSGMPQPADFVLIAFVICCIASGRFVVYGHRIPFANDIAFLLTYMVLLNLCWFGVTHAIGTLSFAQFYLFNLAGFSAFCSLPSHERLTYVRATALAMLLVGGGLAAFVLITNGISRVNNRQVAFFNNPNQLAYFCVFCATYFAVATRFGCISPRLRAFAPAFYFGMLFLTILTMSRAGVVAAAIACSIGLVHTWKHVLVTGVLVCLVLLFGLAPDLFLGTSIDRFANRVERRLDDSSLEEELLKRGFHRIGGNELYLLIGAGEGYDERFYRVGQTVREFHSSLGCLIFGYGIPGILLAWKVVRSLTNRLGFVGLLLLSPPLIYGLGHNGLRQIELWLLPLFVVFAAERRAAANGTMLRRTNYQKASSPRGPKSCVRPT